MEVLKQGITQLDFFFGGGVKIEFNNSPQILINQGAFKNNAAVPETNLTRKTNNHIFYTCKQNVFIFQQLVRQSVRERQMANEKRSLMQELQRSTMESSLK